MNGSNSNSSGAKTFKLRFKPASEAALVSKAIRDELEADGYVVVEAVVEGNIVISQTEPTDTTKVWWKSDINGVPQGSPYTYNSAAGKWQVINSDFALPELPDQRNGEFTVIAGAGPIGASVSFQTIHGGSNYHISLTPRVPDGVTAAGTMPNNAGYQITSKNENGFAVDFFGIPTGGLTWMWEAKEVFA